MQGVRFFALPFASHKSSDLIRSMATSKHYTFYERSARGAYVSRLSHIETERKEIFSQ